MPNRLPRHPASAALICAAALALTIQPALATAALPYELTPQPGEAAGAGAGLAGSPSNVVSPSSEAPSGAETPARRGHRGERGLRRRGGCQLSLAVSSALVAAGEPVTALGRLACPDAIMASDQPVTLYQRQAGSGAHGASAVAETTTEPDGSYQLSSPALLANSSLYVRSPGSRSLHALVRVAPLVVLNALPSGTQLSLGAARAHTHAASTLTFSGTISPAAPGTIVVLQRERPAGSEHWRRIGLGQVDAQGGYAITHAFRIPGEANVRVVARPHGRNVSAASESYSYQILQRQNPQLTIQTSANPLAYGQSLTITGVAAVPAGAPLTLLARTRGGSFAPVATGLTGPGGTYSFTQSPTRNTVYRVADATTRSTPLAEGVKHMLTATPSASALSAGSELTVTGLLAPASAGDTVFLERENPSGVGFHVIDAAGVSSPPSYSISHAFLRTGTETLRIKIASSSENQGAFSAPFTINVTPAPAVALTSAMPTESPPGGESLTGG